MLQSVETNKKVKGVVLEVSSGGKYRLAKYFVNKFGEYICKILKEDMDLFECYDEKCNISKTRIEEYLRKIIPNLPERIYVDADIL